MRSTTQYGLTICRAFLWPQLSQTFPRLPNFLLPFARHVSSFCPVGSHSYFTRREHWPIIKLKFPSLETFYQDNSIRSKACEQYLLQKRDVLAVQATATPCDGFIGKSWYCIALLHFWPLMHFAHQRVIMVAEPWRVSSTIDIGCQAREIRPAPCEVTCAGRYRMVGRNFDFCKFFWSISSLQSTIWRRDMSLRRKSPTSLGFPSSVPLSGQTSKGAWKQLKVVRMQESIIRITRIVNYIA
jgi:hypothetical protein